MAVTDEMAIKIKIKSNLPEALTVIPCVCDNICIYALERYFKGAFE
jgi:hypothetical protein